MAETVGAAGAVHLAAIDPDVEELLAWLLTTPVAFLAREAIDSIIEDQPRLDDERRILGDFGRFEPDRRSRQGQLDLAHRVISGRIKREVRMLERLRSLAPELGLKSLGVLPAERGEAVARDSAELLHPAREAAFRSFLDVWDEIQSDLRQRWENPDAG